jgi:serine aminopeptidase S33 family/PDZ domain-containing protein
MIRIASRKGAAAARARSAVRSERPRRRRPASALGAALLAAAIVNLASLGSVSAAKREASDPLPRRGWLGAQVAPLSPDARAQIGLPDSAGLDVLGAAEGSAAAKAGLRAGDVLLTIDGAGLAAPGQLNARLAGRKPGERFTLEYLRPPADAAAGATEGSGSAGAAAGASPAQRAPAAAHKRISKTIALTEVPRESSALYDVEYGSVATRAGRLRTIVTKPKTRGPHPALYIIQGIGVFTVERLPNAVISYAPIIEDFATRGFVTLRVDKPGCGDSEGGPLKDVDFETQLDGFRQALAMLRADPDVDPARILIFGHSMGGCWGPILAAEIARGGTSEGAPPASADAAPILGIATYGTAVKTWFEYTLENNRRQLALAGVTPAGLDSALRYEVAGNYFLLNENLSPEAIAAAHPDLTAWVDSTFVERKYTSGLHYTFIQQLSKRNLAAEWGAHTGHSLAMWGSSDFITSRDDHAMIAEIANARREGLGELVVLDGVDHGFFEAATPAQSLSEWGKPGRAQSPRIVETLHAWSERVLGASAGGGSGAGGTAAGR